jgi:hypothetical protein
VILGLIGILETLVNIILYWVPFYYPLKAVFLVWAMHPKYEGASLIYNKFLRDQVQANLQHVDGAMEHATVENLAKVVVDANAAMNSSKKD